MEKTACFIIADGTEVTEYLATKDVLERAGIRVKEFGNGFKYQDGVKDHYFRFDPQYFDAIIFPGGSRGTENILYQTTQEPFGTRIKQMASSGKLVAAICAAPSILGKLGILKYRRYTCYPGFSSSEFGGTYTGGTIEIDKNIITARSMYYSVDFGLAIVQYLLGKAKRDEIESQVKGLKPKSYSY